MSNQNVYDTANQLEREIRQLPEVAAIRQALAGIEADETSKTLFEGYKKQVQELSLREAQGHPIGEEEMKQIDELSKGIMADDQQHHHQAFTRNLSTTSLSIGWHQLEAPASPEGDGSQLFLCQGVGLPRLTL